MLSAAEKFSFGYGQNTPRAGADGAELM